ncbi:sensor histidine kinase [Pseudoalteromonas denitrificans]|uniref:histidine kinase n=1 Tax=Pseudoalteromonas denitrificans DSM 6059 TaxID=1123010 RepID=A0A1I1FQI1_9GAMM|nr:ATP-binding protein [Pseudoalteromonas denitrificans]SFC01819.1 Signal transduction histidine kinase [Pseudoalteromonas denitrificans DSM 6059]
MSLQFARNLLTVFIAIFLIHKNVNAQNIIDEKLLDGFVLAPYVSFVYSEADSPKDLLQQKPKFKPLAAKNFTSTTKRVWYKIEFEISKKYTQPLFIQTQFPNAPYLKAFHSTHSSSHPNKWNLVFDDEKTFNKRGYSHPLQTFKFTPKNSKKIIMLVAYENMINVPLNFKLYNENNLQQASVKHVISNSIFIILCLVISLFSLIYILLKPEIKVIAFTLFSTLIALYLSETSGFNYQYVWPEIPKINTFMPPILINLLYVSYLYFTMHIFDLKRKSTFLYRAYYALIVFTTILFGTCLITDSIQIAVSIAILTAPLPLFTAIWAVKNKLWASKFFLFGCICNVLLNNIIAGLFALNIFYSPNINVLFFTKIGFIVEIFAFTAALLSYAWSVQQKLLNIERINIENEKSLHLIEVENRELVAQKALEQQKQAHLQHNADLMQEMLDSKNKFLVDVSHELRTPLTILKLQVELLQNGLEEDLKSSYQKLALKVFDMETFISNLYQLGQLDINAVNLSYSHIDIAMVLNLWSKEFSDSAKERNLVWSFENYLPEQLVLSLDISKLKSVLDHLVNNALRYTHSPGQIKLTAKIDNKNLIIALEDSSPGINGSEYDLIFERLYRVETSRNRKTGGAGLGLAICKGLMAAQKGEISAVSSDLGGVKMVITLTSHINQTLKNDLLDTNNSLLHI